MAVKQTVYVILSSSFHFFKITLKEKKQNKTKNEKYPFLQNP